MLESDRVRDDIRIQENLFDDSSQRQLSQLNQQSGYDQESHDSLLNEQELNNKFSIEDFRNLDKRGLDDPLLLCARPGENIKIAEILRKNEEFKFSLQEVRPDRFQLASQIADDLFAMLIKQEVEVPLMQQQQ